MSSENVSTNLTSTTHNGDFDQYCLTLFVGPLVWSIFSVPCSLVGLLASVWLLWVLIQRQCTGQSNDIYMLNLTSMDLIFNIFVPPCVFNFMYWQDYCYMIICSFLYSLNMSGRPLFMACICVDCYLAVVYPVPYMRLKHSKYRLVVSVLIWVLTLSYGILFVINMHSFSTSVTVIPCILSLPIIVSCDLSILYTLRKPDPSGRTDVHPQKQRALQTITNSLVMALLSYLPPLIMFGFSNMFPLSQQEIYCNVSIPVLIFSTLGSSTLPLLYLGNLGSFKELCRCGSVSVG